MTVSPCYKPAGVANAARRQHQAGRRPTTLTRSCNPNDHRIVGTEIWFPSIYLFTSHGAGSAAAQGMRTSSSHR